ALFGLRLLFSGAPTGRDLVYDVLKIGIVLTIAFSWPAFRTVIHDVVLAGPAQIASSINTPGLPDTGTGMVTRLQSTDDSLVQLTEIGVGRNTGAFLEDGSTGTTFAGSALEDTSALGYARLLYLAGTIGALGLVRLLAGLLLALAPLAAGLLLFEATRGLFAGWLKGLVLAMLGSIGLAIVLAAELAIIAPWLSDALRIRSLGYAAPAAPMEILSMTLAFTLMKFGVIWLLAKVAFARGWLSVPQWPRSQSTLLANVYDGNEQVVVRMRPAETRVERTVDSINRLVGYEASNIRTLGSQRALSGPRVDGRGSQAPAAASVSGTPPLGSTWRRSSARVSRASQQRDRRR
ncbi:MAG: type IV secretion system protein, partial [Hyphomonas sp.]|uniref:type IV secretion system protein n=1 Tax=Hyphomonas sp. TaxID=87 RepID=UPI003298F849